MYSGSTTHNLDSKGRLVLPVKLREAFEAPYVLTRGFSGCIALYPPAQWQTILDKLGRIADTDKKALALRRFYMGAATEVTPDEAGRVLIPKYLRDKAEIQGDVVVIGNGNVAEIWSLEKWNGYDDAELNDDKVIEFANELVPEGMTNPLPTQTLNEER
ncbi:MAG TPA: division/cell wall cluster transcriptional repressor MraZ [Armatimonadota bacterium]|jgi:MraZ protein